LDHERMIGPPIAAFAGDIFLCSSCNGLMKGDGNAALVCSACGAAWPCEGGLVSGPLDRDYYFGKYPKETRSLIDRLNQDNLDGFVEDLRRNGRTGTDLEYAYCVDPARADPIALIDLSEATVLDIGAGWGAVSIPLAKRAQRVISVDADITRLRFASLRARSLHLDNLVFVHADITKLRLRSHVFDAATAIGAMEWIPDPMRNSPPYEAQLDFLGRIHNTLREGGILVMAIENRLSIQYFFGITDHGDLPFTPLLPRRIANAVTKVWNKKPYSHLTHTAASYRRLLESAGFRSTTFYAAIPGYKQPSAIAPLEAELIKSAAYSLHSRGDKLHGLMLRAARFLARTGALKHVVPAFVILAEA